MLSRTVAALVQQLVGSTYCSCQIKKIIAWPKGMPGKHPAPHDQEPLHHAVSQESGMILIAYCCVDEKAVVIKLHNASACAQPRLNKLQCISASIEMHSEMAASQAVKAAQAMVWHLYSIELSTCCKVMAHPDSW